MSMAQGSYAEPQVGIAPVVPIRRRTPLSGAWLLSIAMVGSGVLTYVFLVLTARTLGARDYGRIGVLWGAMFIVAIVLFRPIEQTLSRTIADRRARGEEVRSVLRAAAAVALAIAAIGAIAVAIGWQAITSRLFGGDNLLMAMLVFGIAAYGFSYLVRGLAGGALWFDGYGINLLADGLSRLALGLPLVLVASRNVAAAAVVGAGLVGALVPLRLGRDRLRPLLEQGSGTPFRLGSALRFAAPASTIAAADQMLVNGSPLLVMVGGRGDVSKVAGVVFAATMLVRAPVYVFQGLAAALLPNLTHLSATIGNERMRRDVFRVAVYLLAGGAVITGVAASIGPAVMHVLYGSDFSASRTVLALLGAGVGLYLPAATLSQALLALDSGRAAAWAWAASGGALILFYAVMPGSELMRVALSFAFAVLLLLISLAALLVRRLERS
jgi:O-antigen/teichoic acid export membrane protein